MAWGRFVPTGRGRVCVSTDLHGRGATNRLWRPRATGPVRSKTMDSARPRPAGSRVQRGGLLVGEERVAYAHLYGRGAGLQEGVFDEALFYGGVVVYVVVGEKEP